MPHDAIGSWVENAKKAEAQAMPESAEEGIIVIRTKNGASRGNIIMEVADKLFPGLMKMYEGVRDDKGFVVQPAHVRGLALDVAQRIVADNEKKTA